MWILTAGGDTLNEVQETAEKVIENPSVLQNMIAEFSEAALNLAVKIVLTVIIYLVASRLIRFLCKVIRKNMERVNMSREAVTFVTSFTKVALYFFLVASIAVSFGIEAASIAALFASAGVALSLALQGGLSNIAGGVIILLLKPIKAGEYIISASNNLEGTVKKVDMYYTTLGTLDNRTVLIPNSQLTNNSIVNVTAMDQRKLEIKVGISYNAVLRLAKKILEKLMDDDPRFFNVVRVIFVDQLADSSVILGLRGWVKTEEYWALKWDMNEKIKLSFDKAGIEIPYPQLTVHMPGESAGKESEAAVPGEKKAEG